MYDILLHRQGVLIVILLPQVVDVVHLMLSMLPGYPDYESRAVIEGDVLSHDVHCFSNLYSQSETGFAGFAVPRAER
jgi:hypothetical protein